MNIDGVYLKVYTRSLLLLLQGLIIIFILYLVLGSLNGIMVWRYERNAFVRATQTDIQKEINNQNGRVAGIETSREGIENGYIVDPQVILTR